MADREKFIRTTPELYAYVLAHGHNDDPIRAALAEETSKLGFISGMQISPEQGTFMGLLAGAIGARSAVEVGTFTGYSALCVARALPAEGRLLCCDVNEQCTSIGRRYWQQAGVAGRITLKLRPAIETLKALPESTRFDFAFIDADKTNYRNYYEEILRRSRPGALILIDNVLWDGSVIDPANQTADTVAIRALNDFLATDQRVETVMLSIADGLTILRKR